MSKILYNKYRPSHFDEVVGQDIVVKILKRSIEKENINRSYLFYGVRGTGKTTLARIFAKTINCHNIINGNPCNKCESCITFNKKSAIDLIELDAASHNGVNEIRNITENANYASTYGNYKIYIIDEVHMLSKSAFNALLKTLEEPPEKTIFLLATTEINKIPDTILSRTIILNLELIDFELIKSKIKEILNKENIDYDEESINYVAKLANGSMRDAISFVETCLLYSNQLSAANVVKVLGILSYDDIELILEKRNIESISLINEKMNGYRLLILFIERVFDQISNDNFSNIGLLEEFANGLLKIKDPILLNKYIKIILIKHFKNEVINVSRETLEKNITIEHIEENLASNTTEKLANSTDKTINIKNIQHNDSLHNNHVEEGIHIFDENDDKFNDIEIDTQNLKEDIENNNIDIENKNQQSESQNINSLNNNEEILINEENVSRETKENIDIENKNQQSESQNINSLNNNEEILINEENVSRETKEEKNIFDSIETKEIIKEMLWADNIILNKIKNKLYLIDIKSVDNDEKHIYKLIIQSKPLLATKKMIILGFESEYQFEEFKKISGTCILYRIIKSIFDKGIIIIPVTSNRWEKMSILGKQLLSTGKKEKTIFIPKDIFNCKEEETLDIAIDIFGDKFVNE